MKRFRLILLLFCIALVVSSVACDNSSLTSSSGSGDQDDADIPKSVKFVGQDIKISDGLNSKKLTLGVAKKIDSGFNLGTDVESPPFNPPGAFYAYLKNDEYNLFKDVRQFSSDKVIKWTLEYAPEEGQKIKIKWDFNDRFFNGSLRLVDNTDDPKVIVDMKTKNSYAPKGEGGKLYIVYTPK